MMDPNGMDDLVRVFVAETSENLDLADNYMVELESDPGNTELLSHIFRTVHTVKGTSGFLGYTELGALTHNAENLLSLLHDGEISLTEEITTALLATFDGIRAFLANIEHGTESDASYEDLIATLARLAEASGAADAGTQVVGTTTRGPDTSGADATANFLRIDVTLVDKLMSLVGELVLARNQMVRFAHGDGDTAFLNAVQRLNHVTSELQEGVLRTRMQPMSTVWNKVPRMVRDLALSCEKKVRVQFEGGDTELDKTVIEAFKDPLIHMVRNTVDHGIESPADRSAAGKSAEGLLVLRAFHESGQVNIEISDDGRGIDIARLRDRAIERRLISEDEAERMKDQEIANLVFLPGLTTAQRVSGVSGRGVGMDVVKSNIESIGGTIELRTSPGVGTTIKIKIPLTLAIVPALIIRSAGEKFALPQVHLRELVRLENSETSTTVEMVHGAPVCRLRDRLLPLVFLSRELGLTSEECNTDSMRRLAFGSQLAVLDAGGYSFGLVVDAIANPEEIVVKPLPRQIKGLQVFAGAAVMGDGSVALILDVQGLAQRARVVSTIEEQGSAERGEDTVLTDDECQAYLIVDAGDERRAAIPMRVVDRLEAFPQTAVETTIRGRVVQYRDGVMPLIPLAELMGLDDRCEQTPDSLPVIVCSHEGRPTGVVVPGIVDIVKDGIAPSENAVDGGGIVGTAVFQGRATDVLDFETLLESAKPVVTARADARGETQLGDGGLDV